MIRFGFLAEYAKNTLRQQKLGKTIASESTSKAQNINHITISQVLQWNSCGRCTWERRRLRFSNASKIFRKKTQKRVQFPVNIIFMSMYNDIECWKKNNRNEWWNNAAQSAQYARDFKPRHWSFLGLGEMCSEDTSIFD